MPPPLRVAAIMQTPIISGPGRQLAAVAGALTQHGVDLRVITLHRQGQPLSPFVTFLEQAGVASETVEERGRADVSVLGRLRAALQR